MKHIKLYEDFDIDKFLENPEEHIKGEIVDTIKKGDYVKTYRGIGQVIDMDQNFIVINLMGSGEGSRVKVPKDKVERISKDDALKSRNPSKEADVNELKRLSRDLEEYIQAGIYDDEEGNRILTGGVDRAIEYIEDVLVDLLNLIRKNPDLIYYPEFVGIGASVAYLSEVILDNDESKDTNERMSAILSKFEEIMN